MRFSFLFDIYIEKSVRYITPNNKTDKNDSKNMNKKNTIRLTESELKRVISESVKQVISELDWKTKQWAADERQRRDNDVYYKRKNSPYYNKYQKQNLDPANNRYANNQLEAAKEFNKRYGLEDYERDTDGAFTARSVAMDTMGGLNATYATTKQTGKRNGENGWHTRDTTFGNNKFDTDDTRTRNAYNRAKDELNKYENGDYEYVKGKGWILKNNK